MRVLITSSRMPFALGMVRKLAVGRLGSYFARAAFSRGGICCLTNTGPLAGWLDMDEVHPTPASPWLVQPFVEGETVCTIAAASGETMPRNSENRRSRASRRTWSCRQRRRQCAPAWLT